MKLSLLDVLVSLLLVALGIYVIWHAAVYGILGPTITGPGFFPLLSGLMILIGAAGVLAGHIRKSRVMEGRITGPETVPVVLITLFTVIFLLLAEPVGMILLTPLYVFGVASAILPPRSLRTILCHCVVAVGFTLFAYLLFDYALGIPLPDGLLAD